MNNIKFFLKKTLLSFLPQPKKSIEDRVHLDIIIKKAKRKKERKEGKSKTEKIKELYASKSNKTRTDLLIKENKKWGNDQISQKSHNPPWGDDDPPSLPNRTEERVGVEKEGGGEGAKRDQVI